jgi:hypothetical protein
MRCWVRPTSCRTAHASARCTPIEYSPWVVPRTLTFESRKPNNRERLSHNLYREKATSDYRSGQCFRESYILVATRGRRPSIRTYAPPLISRNETQSDPRIRTRRSTVQRTRSDIETGLVQSTQSRPPPTVHVRCPVNADVR